MLICGILLIALTLFNISIGLRSKKWPLANGVVIESFVQKREPKNISKTNTRYHPFVFYKYEIDGKEYESSRLGTFLMASKNEVVAKNIVSRFSTGESVEVYYSPFYPKLSALIPGVQQKMVHFCLMLFGTMITLFTLPVIITDNPYWLLELVT